MGVLGLYMDTGVFGRSALTEDGVLGLSGPEDVVLDLSAAGDLGRLRLAMMLAAVPERRLDAVEARELHTDLALSRTELHDRFWGSAEDDRLLGPALSLPPSWPRGESGLPSPEGLGTDRLLVMSFLNSDSVMVLIWSMLSSWSWPPWP